MERPQKRPRLSLFADELPSAELDTARVQNDRHLKWRFEAIFEKYGRDFSEVGDEIDLSTGEIVVNNGHLAGLTEAAETRSEADESKGDEPLSPTSNLSPARRRLVTNGRSMLRAMTVAPDCDDAYFDNESAEDVIESIETIAENAALSERHDATMTASDNSDDNNNTDDESDADDEGDEGSVEGIAAAALSDGPVPIPILENLPAPDLPADATESDNDSLFEVPNERDSSPDSLFEQPSAASSATPYEDIDPKQFFDSVGDLDHEAVIARFGDKVGQEILDLIQRRDKAELHIEAAWRIPVQLEDQPGSRNGSPVAVPEPERFATVTSATSSTSKKRMSLWDMSAPKRSKLELHQDRTLTVIRAESEDPLQAGFGESGHVEVRVAQISLDRATRLLNRGTCPYCKEQYFSLSAAQEHLCTILEDLKTGTTQPGTHNADQIEGLLAALRATGVDIADVSTEPASGEQLDATVDTGDHVPQSVETEAARDSTPFKPHNVQNRSNADESEDDLFVDAGHKHNTNRTSPDAVEKPAGLEQNPLQARHNIASIEIQDSDDELESGPCYWKGPSARRRRKSSSFRGASDERFAIRPSSAKGPAQHQGLHKSTEATDRSGSCNLGANVLDNERPRLTFRPRRVKKDINYALRPKRRPRAPERKQVAQPARAQAVANDEESASSRFTILIHSNRGVAPQAMASTAHMDRDDNDGQSEASKHALLDNVSNDDHFDIGNSSDENGDETPLTDSLEDINAAFEPVKSRPERTSVGDEETSSYETDDDDLANDRSSSRVYHFTVSDFKSIVIHHEVAGHDLEAFGETMANHYYNYRLPLDPLLGSEMRQSEWLSYEDVLLYGLSVNPETLMETIKRRFPERSQFDIGNRLAERWLMESTLDSRQPVMGRAKRGSDRRILNFADLEANVNDYDDMNAPRDARRRPERLTRRICRDLNPDGIWRGCGKVYSQRAALTRHWKETDRACLRGDFVPWMSGPKQRTRATKDNGLPCRSASPGGTIRGCQKLFRSKSTLNRHWRQSGAACRPHDYKIRNDNNSIVEEVPESDHDAAAQVGVAPNPQPTKAQG